MQVDRFRLVAGVAVATLCVAGACGTASQSQTHTSPLASSDDVVARIGEQQITLSELDEKVRASNMDIFQQLYQARKQALGELVGEALLRQEAEARGVSRDELVETEITSNVAPVTDADVEAFYTQNRAQLRGQTLEQIGDQIREFMSARNEAVARQAFIDGLRGETEVDIALEPPRVNVMVADNERVRGPSDATVTIVEYSDFQ